MSDGLFFYFMKVGAGNRLIDFPEHLGELEKRKGLFVGYHGRDIPDVTPDGDFQGPLEDKELRTIALASRKALQARSIACVFTESHLTFWEITDYLGALPPEEVRRFARIPYGDLDQALDYDKDWRAATAVAAGGQINVATFFQGYHWLPARLLHAMPRYELLAPVDSLRVHRWLNSGTFEFRMDTEAAIRAVAPFMRATLGPASMPKFNNLQTGESLAFNYGNALKALETGDISFLRPIWHRQTQNLPVRRS